MITIKEFEEEGWILKVDKSNNTGPKYLSFVHVLEVLDKGDTILVLDYKYETDNIIIRTPHDWDYYDIFLDAIIKDMQTLITVFSLLNIKLGGIRKEPEIIKSNNTYNIEDPTLFIRDPEKILKTIPNKP